MHFSSSSPYFPPVFVKNTWKTFEKNVEKPLSVPRKKERGSREGFLSLFIGSTAAAEDNQQSDDNDPDPIVVKQIAKTVIHSKVLPRKVQGLLPFDTII